MAAKIESTKTAPREVRGARHIYTVQLTPAGVMIRIKNTRGWYGPVSYDALYSLGAKLEAGVPPLARPRAGRRS